MTRRLVLLSAVLLLLVCGGLPLLAMLVRSVAGDGRLDVTGYRELFLAARAWRLLGRSLLLATSVTAGAMGIGVPLALLAGRTDLPGRRAIPLLFTVPLLLPPYVVAVGWSDLLAAWPAASRLLYGLPGCVLVLVTILLPVPLLLGLVFLRTVDPALEEAARLESGWGGVLRRVTLPAIRPGLLAAALLVFLLALGEVTVPLYLRWDVYPVESFVRFTAFHDVRAATAAAAILAGVALVLLGVVERLRRDRADDVQPSADDAHRPLVSLGRRRRWLVLAVAALAAVLVLAPLAGLVVRSLSAGAYREALARAGDSLGRSLLYAAVGATLLTVVGFAIGYVVQRRALPGWRALDALMVLLFALPGTVIGVGLVVLWNRPATGWIYGTPLIVLAGYLARYSVLPVRIVAARLAQLPPHLEEAARLDGAGWGRRLTGVLLPLCHRALLASWLAAYVFCLRDTAVTMLVYPPGRETLPVRILTLMANGSPDLIAALCVLMVGATLLPAGLWLVLRGRFTGMIGEG